MAVRGPAWAAAAAAVAGRAKLPRESLASAVDAGCTSPHPLAARFVSDGYCYEAESRHARAQAHKARGLPARMSVPRAFQTRLWAHLSHSSPRSRWLVREPPVGNVRTPLDSGLSNCGVWPCRTGGCCSACQLRATRFGPPAREKQPAHPPPRCCIRKGVKGRRGAEGRGAEL